MKKQITITLLILISMLFGINTNAQTTATVTTTVNIILADVISIDGGSVANGGGVDFNYATVGDYNEDKSVIVRNSLIITSSKNFGVVFKANGVNFVNGSVEIPVEVMKIKAVSGGSMVGEYNDVELSTDDQVLVSNATLGARKTLDIEYSISKDKAQTVLLGKEAGTYTQTVTYTATTL